MESSAESSEAKRVCPGCGKEKLLKSFYPKAEKCRSCLNPGGAREAMDRNLRHQQVVQAGLLRQEMKKLAKKKLENKERRRKYALRKRLEQPKSAEPGKLKVDAPTIHLARRTLARRRLVEFVKYFNPRYKAGWVHIDICNRLEKFSADVDAGRSPRLMILMPPRHGKSEIASRSYPAWHLGHYPHHEFIGCSYNLDLARTFSRQARDIIATPEYANLFPSTKISKATGAAEQWAIAGGLGMGGYSAAGVDGGITGKGAHVLAIDDPFKGIDEADSLEHRTKVWDWYKWEAYSRLAPGGGVLVVQTWWNYDDLAGRLQELMRDNPNDPYIDHFEIVKYPAIAMEDEKYRMKGEALHPDRYDLQHLLRIQANSGGASSRLWSALYQQDPIPAEGAYFSKDMFVYRDWPVELRDCNIIQTWDLAISEKKVNDWTVGTTIAQDSDDRIHVLEQRRFRTSDAGRITAEMIDMYRSYQNVAFFGAEDGQIWRAMKATLRDAMKREKVYIPLDDEPASPNKLRPITDKLTRARPLQGRMQAKSVTFPRGAPWVDDLIKEALRFPGGANDDTIDSLAWAAIVAGKRSPPQRRRPQYGKKPEKTVEEKLKAFAKRAGGSAMAA